MDTSAIQNTKRDVLKSVIAQATVRVKIGLPVIGLMVLSVWYWGSPFGEAGLKGAAIMAAIHISYAVLAYFLAVRSSPEAVDRMVVGTAILDPLVLSGWIGLMGESGGLFFCFYLFTILGFGFRIGVPPMRLCQIVAIAGYSLVLYISPTWRQHTLVGFSFFMLLVVVPMYATVLIKKLRDARALAENESAAKSQLLANVSHELRTPLTGIIATAQLIASETQDLSLIRRSETILRLSNDLVVEVNDLLDSAKYQAQSLTMDATTFDLSEVLEQVRVSLTSTARAKGIDFNVSMDLGIQKPVIGDPHYLGRVLMNMSSNAVKFTDTGSVDVSLKLLGDLPDSYRVRFSVRDTGIGIPKEMHEKIFEPFVQASSGTARKYGGTGLGMSIARDIVGLMGGNIVIESEPGKGSLFYFDVSFPKGVELAKKEKESEALPTVQGKRILVADDNATNLLLLKELLQRDAHDVMTASSGEEAVTALTENEFDLVFLDFNMGDMDGATVLQIYRFGKTDPAPTYFLTADTTARTADALGASGAVGVLHKPVTGEALRAAIARVFVKDAPNAKPAPPPPKPVQVKPVPLQYVDPVTISELRSLSPEVDFFAKILTEAMSDIARNAEILKEAVEAVDVRTVRERAHALKGVSVCVGARRLIALSDSLMNIEAAELKAGKTRWTNALTEETAAGVRCLREHLDAASRENLDAAS